MFVPLPSISMLLAISSHPITSSSGISSSVSGTCRCCSSSSSASAGGCRPHRRQPQRRPRRTASSELSTILVSYWIYNGIPMGTSVKTSINGRKHRISWGFFEKEDTWRISRGFENQGYLPVTEKDDPPRRLQNCQRICLVSASSHIITTPCVGLSNLQACALTNKNTGTWGSLHRNWFDCTISSPGTHSITNKTSHFFAMNRSHTRAHSPERKIQKASLPAKRARWKPTFPKSLRCSQQQSWKGHLRVNSGCRQNAQNMSTFDTPNKIDERALVYP